MEAAPLRSARPLSVLLGRERQLLERICWQLKVAQVLVDTDRLGWAGPSLRETDLLADRLGVAEFTRALQVAGHAEALGLAGEPTLDELAARWPLPGRPALRRHALHLRRLIGQARSQARAVTTRLEQEPRHEEPLEALVRSGGLEVARRVPPPSLVDFVG
ncbi:MAG: hypothetical protein ABIW46_07255 [Acidimicrobiales bacterium]